MNRRQFISGAVALPGASTAMEIQIPTASLVTEFSVDDEIEVQMRISAHLTSQSAEAWRGSWDGRAFEEQGEWYLMARTRRTLPEELATMPGDMAFYEFRWGEAGEWDSILAGTFRREHIACVFRIWGDHKSLLLELGKWFASRPLPDTWELMWSDVQLESFVPTTEEFGRTIDRHDDRHWF